MQIPPIKPPLEVFTASSPAAIPPQFYSVQELQAALSGFFSQEPTTNGLTVLANAIQDFCNAYASNSSPSAQDKQLYLDLTTNQNVGSTGESFQQMAANFLKNGENNFQYFNEAQDSANPLWQIYDSDIPSWLQANPGVAFQTSITPGFQNDIKTLLNTLRELGPGNAENITYLEQLANQVYQVANDLTGNPPFTDPLCQTLYNFLNSTYENETIIQAAENCANPTSTSVTTLDSFSNCMQSQGALFQSILQSALNFAGAYPPAST